MRSRDIIPPASLHMMPTPGTGFWVTLNMSPAEIIIIRIDRVKINEASWKATEIVKLSRV